MKPHITYDDDAPEFALAYIHPASEESVDRVINAPIGTNDGRSAWVWVRLRNGDLVLGVFPQGDTYLHVEHDAHWPGTESRPKKPRYYQCGICDSYHSAEWNGDCREDDARFFADQLDEKHGPYGWDEVPMPGTEDTV